MECKTKGDTSNNSGDWDYFKVIQKIREQHTRKHEVEELQKTAILGPAHITSESTNIKVDSTLKLTT